MVIFWIVLVFLSAIGLFVVGFLFGCEITHSLLTKTDELNQPVPESLKQSRSSKWEKVRNEHLKQEPKCAICETDNEIEVHHIKPFHVYPDLELESSNLITLCRTHHYDIAHLRDWSAYNPNIKIDCMWLNYKIRHRVYGRLVKDE